MKLSYLIYLSAKAAADYGDASFTYESYMSGEAQKDEDYASFIDKALTEVNAFLQRVSTLNKVPAVVESFTLTKGQYQIAFPNSKGRVITVFQYRNDQSNYDVLSYSHLGNAIFLRKPFRNEEGDTVWVQYRPKIEWYREADIIPIEATEYDGSIQYLSNGEYYDSFTEAEEANEVDLTEEYGLSNEILALCVDWVKARLMDSRTEGQAKEIEVESRINDVTLDEVLITPYKVRRIHF